MKGESSLDYKSLLNGLRESLQIQGKLEEVLVEKLASLLWRMRRLLQAETAEIMKVEIPNCDHLYEYQIGELEYAQLTGRSEGNLGHGSILNVLQTALEILRLVRISFKADDPQVSEAHRLLRWIYGYEENGPAPYGFRQLILALSKLPSSAEQGKEPPEDPAEQKQIMRDKITKEMTRLKDLFRTVMTAETLKGEHFLAEGHVPSLKVSDRLVRYEAHLSREFDRTLAQLERLQRMRRGQTVLPPIKVEVSS